MGNQHLPPIIQSILDSALTPRHQRQIEIEGKIDSFRPDFAEAVDILHALEAALRARYDHALLDDVAHYFLYARKALERAEAEYMSSDQDRE